MLSRGPGTFGGPKRTARWPGALAGDWKWARALDMDHMTTFCYIDFAAKCLPGAPDPDGGPQRAARRPGASEGVWKRVRVIPPK